MTLLKRLEEGPGSRELSDECLLAVGWKMVGRPPFNVWYKPNGEMFRSYIRGNVRPDPSQNLQDAVDWMVPEGHGWSVMTHDRTDEGRMPGACVDGCSANAPTPALALCAAGIRAMEGQSDG